MGQIGDAVRRAGESLSTVQRGATHELKTQPVFFDAVARGDKNFEARKNDRNFLTGDTLILRRYGHVDGKLTYMRGKEAVSEATSADSIVARVSFSLYGFAGSQHGIPEDVVVMGLHDVRLLTGTEVPAETEEASA